EVREAQVEAAQHFVNMLELQRAVGKRLSELTGAESGIVTSGAAGAMAAATAGCMAGTDDKHIWQLPDTTGLKHEVIMVCGRSGLLLGRKDLIEAALLNCSPREGAVCRPMKVGKEEIIGCLTALETWLKLDEKKVYVEWNGRIDRIRKLVETVPGVTTGTFVPE